MLIRAFFILLIALFFTCNSQNTFEFTGTPPEQNFAIIDMSQGDLEQIPIDSLPTRNRVYIQQFDEKLFINGHLTNLEQLGEDFRYIVTNPSALPHLPETPNQAILILETGGSTATDHSGIPDLQYDKNIMAALRQVEEEMKGAYAQQKFGKSLSELTKGEKGDLYLHFAWKRAYEMPPPNDRGTLVELPPWSNEEPDMGRLKNRNLLTVLVDAQNQISVRAVPLRLEDLRAMTKNFIANPENAPDMAESPSQAVISLKNERGTSYKTYLAVYNELKAAYYELWDELSQERYDMPYSDDMPLAYQKAIKKEIPFIISEAEPTSFGEE